VDATIFACIAKQPHKLMFGTVENQRGPFRQSRCRDSGSSPNLDLAVRGTERFDPRTPSGLTGGSWSRSCRRRYRNHHDEFAILLIIHVQAHATVGPKPRSASPMRRSIAVADSADDHKFNSLL
jgi:hypothetical protein